MHRTLVDRHQHFGIHYCLHLHKRDIFHYKILAPSYQTKGHHIIDHHNLDIHYHEILSYPILYIPVETNINVNYALKESQVIPDLVQTPDSESC